MPRPTASGSQHRIQRGRARPAVRPGARLSVAAWGALMVIGGVATWSSVGEEPAPLPEMWNPTAASTDASARMTSALRKVPSGEQSLLRLEWPEHPGAVEYRIRFRADPAAPPIALAVQSPVFLYDLESNALRLPSTFEWEVAAVLRDGSEVVSPWRVYPD